MVFTGLRRFGSSGLRAPGSEAAQLTTDNRQKTFFIDSLHLNTDNRCSFSRLRGRFGWYRWARNTHSSFTVEAVMGREQARRRWRARVRALIVEPLEDRRLLSEASETVSSSTLSQLLVDPNSYRSSSLLVQFRA